MHAYLYVSVLDIFQKHGIDGKSIYYPEYEGEKLFELSLNFMIFCFISLFFNMNSVITHYVSLSNHCSDFAPVHSVFSSWPYAFHHVY